MGDVIKHPAVLEQTITAPVPIAAIHDITKFDCGKQPLNDWLRHHALKSEGNSARCFVVCVGSAVVGYYCLSTGAVAHAGAPRLLKANMPNPTPVMVIGRLAVDKEFQGRGIGRGMLKDGLARVLQASKLVGAKAVIVHAIDAEAVPFYAAYGFKSFSTETRTMFLPISTIAQSL